MVLVCKHEGQEHDRQAWTMSKSCVAHRGVFEEGLGGGVIPLSGGMHLNKPVVFADFNKDVLLKVAVPEPLEPAGVLDRA